MSQMKVACLLILTLGLSVPPVWACVDLNPKKITMAKAANGNTLLTVPFAGNTENEVEDDDGLPTLVVLTQAAKAEGDKVAQYTDLFKSSLKKLRDEGAKFAKDGRLNFIEQDQWANLAKVCDQLLSDIGTADLTNEILLKFATKVGPVIQVLVSSEQFSYNMVVIQQDGKRGSRMYSPFSENVFDPLPGFFEEVRGEVARGGGCTAYRLD